jgi:hypothetical protein
MKQQFLKGIEGTIRMTVYEKNRPKVPTSATITLYKNNGSTVIQAEDTASVNATTGELTYLITAVHTANLGVNYKAVWAYVINGTTYYETQLFDVVRSILSIPITDDDLYKELPSLHEANIQASGTSTATGTTSTLVDSLKRKETDDYWKGGTIEILSGTGAKQSRAITGNVQSTGTISVFPNWVTTPDNTSVYKLVKSWYAVIDQSFEKIEQMLYDKGNRPALIMESSQIRIPLIYLTLATICLDLRDEVDDKWDMNFKEYKSLFEKSFTTLKLDYDRDESGGVQGDEAQMSISQLKIYRS